MYLRVGFGLCYCLLVLLVRGFGCVIRLTGLWVFIFFVRFWLLFGFCSLYDWCLAWVFVVCYVAEFAFMIWRTLVLGA